MNRPIIQLILIQFREFFREPGILFWAILFPILTAWILGVAFTKKVDTIYTIGLIENTSSSNPKLRNLLRTHHHSHDSETAEKVYELIIPDENFGNTKINLISTNSDHSIEYLKRGIISLVMIEKQDSVKFQLDPKNPEAKLIYLQIAPLFEETKNDNITRIEPLSNKGTRYIDFFIPGLLAMGIMNSCMWGISYSLIDFRAKKLLRRMVATPMKKTSFMLSHLIARFCLGCVEGILLYLFAAFYFDFYLEGSFLALFLIFAAGHIAFAGLSIFMASRTANTQIGNAYINALSLPMMFLSGIFFSYHNFPDWSIPIIQKLPLTMLADSMRSIFTEGAGIQNVLLETGLLTGIGLIFAFIGLKMYKWH